MSGQHTSRDGRGRPLWEHKVTVLSRGEFESYLNGMGIIGWELVSFELEGVRSVVAVLKRPWREPSPYVTEPAEPVAEAWGAS